MHVDRKLAAVGLPGAGLSGYLAVHGSTALLYGAVALIPAVVVAARLGLWRSAVTVSFAASVLRTSGVVSEETSSIWYALQFGSLAIAALVLLAAGRSETQPRAIDRWIVYGLGVFVAAAACSAAVSGSTNSQAQVAALAGMTGFLALTFARRWTSPGVLRGDFALIFALVAVVQLVGLAGVAAGMAWATDPDFGRFQGLFSNANYAGMLSAITLPLALLLWPTIRGWARLAVTTGIAAMLGAMLLSGSRGAILAAAVGLFVAGYARSARRFLGRSAAAAGVGGLVAWLINPTVLNPLTEFFSRDGQGADITSGRVAIYRELLRRWEVNPLLGTGYRSTEELGAIGSQTGLAGHNIYLSVLAETGLIGAVVFLCLLAFIFRARGQSGSARILTGAAAAVAAVELTESSLYGWGGPTALFAWLLLLGCAAAGRPAEPAASGTEAPPAEAAAPGVQRRPVSAPTSAGTYRRTRESRLQPAWPGSSR